MRKVNHMPYITKKKTNLKRKQGKQKQIATLYSSSKWQKLRAAYIMENPLCEICLQENVTNVAQEIHHKKPISRGETIEEMKELAFDYGNLQSLCTYHHHEIHKQMKQ